MTQDKADKKVKIISIDKRYVDINQLSDYTSLGISTLYKLVHKNCIPYIKKGKKLLFDLHDIDHWMAQDKILTSPASPSIFKVETRDKRGGDAKGGILDEYLQKIKA
jgi:excisionase family DNA binding protein